MYASCGDRGDIHLCDHAFALYVISDFLDGHNEKQDLVRMRAHWRTEARPTRKCG